MGSHGIEVPARLLVTGVLTADHRPLGIYENAQKYLRAGQYPLRCNIFRTLFGHIPARNTTLPFHREDVALQHRKRIDYPHTSICIQDYCR